MSGITASTWLNGSQALARQIRNPLKAMDHRGPDGHDVWIDGQTALGHLAFNTLGEAPDGIQRLPGGPSNLAIAADARLDNRADLSKALEFPVADCPDSRIILAAYARWGQACLDRLVGDFSFVIWDGPRRRLFAARDHLGIKPFYYWLLPGRRILIASEIKGLFGFGEALPAINEARIADYLADVEDDREATFFEGVRRLPPAHFLILEERLTVTRYWSPDPETELRLGSDEEYGEAFREVFFKAVEDRLRGPLPVGVSLSGGLDSCSVACVARESFRARKDRKLHTFSMRHDSFPEEDEREYIDALVDQGGLEAHFVLCDDLCPLDYLDSVLPCFEEPPNSIYCSLAWNFWSHVGNDSVRVLLDGVDGDVTVSYAFIYLADLARRGQWPTLLREAVGLSRYFWLERVSPFSILWRAAVKPNLPGFFARRDDSVLGEAEGIVDPGFARRVGLAGRLEELRFEKSLLRTPRQFHCADVTHGVLAYAVEGTNKMTAALGLEPRHPFFDKRLVDFCIALPREQRVRDGWTRVVMRRALRDLLPEKVRLHGDKFDASERFAQRLVGPDRGRLDRLMTRDAPLRRDFVDQSGLEKALRRADANPSYQNLLSVWRPVALGAWLRSLRESTLFPPERQRKEVVDPVFSG